MVKEYELLSFVFSVRAIVALNLHSYGSGRNPWGNLTPEYLEKVLILWILYSYFEVVVLGNDAQYIFLDSLMFKIWKKCVTNIIDVLDII